MWKTKHLQDFMELWAVPCCQGLPYLSGASEGHFVDVHVGGDGGSCCGPVARDDVHHTRGESSLPVPAAHSNIIPFPNQAFHSSPLCDTLEVPTSNSLYSFDFPFDFRVLYFN